MKRIRQEFKSRFDMFPTELEIKFPSYFGAGMSILVYIFAATYGLNKFLIMSRYDDTIQNAYTVRNELGDDQIS